MLADRGADLEAKDGVSRARLVPVGADRARAPRVAAGRSVDGGGGVVCWLPLGGMWVVASAVLCEGRGW